MKVGFVFDVQPHLERDVHNDEWLTMHMPFILSILDGCAALNSLKMGFPLMAVRWRVALNRIKPVHWSWNALKPSQPASHACYSHHS